MGEYAKEQQKQQSRAIANGGGGSRQLKFVDNRNTIFSQKDTMKYAVDDTIQRAVSYEEIGDYPDIVREKRTLVKRGRIIDATPTFKKNLGYINGVDGVYENIGPDSHTEKVLLCKKYNPTGVVLTRWDDIKNLVMSEKFTLYTERKPCPNCKAALDSDSFTSENKVLYSFDDTPKKQEKSIEAEHQGRIGKLS